MQCEFSSKAVVVDNIDQLIEVVVLKFVGNFGGA
jgi:hypothetical protein